MASPPSPPHAEGGASAGAVCCMCGDQGLPGELARCRRCRVRLQHRYCSDLYPRAAAYRRCNWCLREPASDQGRRAGHAAAAVANKAEERRKAASGSSSSSDEERRQRQRHEGFSSRRPPAEPGHPVKKKHKADQEKMPPPPPPPPAEGKEIVADASGRKEVMRAGKTRASRVKVRRYKLLAEVISC